MKKYITLMLCSIQTATANRMTFVSTVLMSMIRVLVFYYLWMAVYTKSGGLKGYSWQEMKTYVFISFLVNTLLSFYAEMRISNDIRTGAISMDLLKPMDYQKARFSEAIGISMFEGIVTIITVSLISFLFFRISPPTSFINGVFFIVSFVVGFFNKFCISYITGLACFWTQSAVGISWTRSAITDILSGALIPLNLFPGLLRDIVMVLPFKNIVYVPLSIYLGKLEGMEMLYAVMVQVIWFIILWFLARILFERAVRKLTIHGG